MRRVLAAVGAVAFVAVAVLVRQAIDDDGDGGGDGRGSAGDLVVCATDLAEACSAPDDAEVRVEAAATTAAAIQAGDLPEGTVWVTTSAWLEVATSRAPGALGEAELVARSPVVVAVDPLRADAVERLCGGAVLRCLGDHAGGAWGELGGDARWGPLRTGLPDADSATGLALLGAVTSGWFGSTEFAANDFDAGGLAAWLGTLARPSGSGDPDPAGTLVTRRGQYTAAATTRARTSRLGPDRVAVLETEPAVAVEVVVVRVGDGRPEGTGTLREALDAAGWEPVDGPAAPRYKPGVLAALHTLWTEVT